MYILNIYKNYNYLLGRILYKYYISTFINSTMGCNTFLTKIL